MRSMERGGGTAVYFRSSTAYMVSAEKKLRKIGRFEQPLQIRGKI